MKRLALTALILSTALSTAAFAQDEGFYIGVAGGANIVHDDNISAPTVNAEIEKDAGIVGTTSLGYKYENGFRNEIELGYRRNNVDTIADVAADGDTEVYSAMVNLLFDLDITGTDIDTYIGGGAGGALIRHDKVGAVAGTQVDDSDFTPAFQGIAGISYALSESTDIFMNYQYFSAVNPQFETDTNTKVDIDYDASSLMVGLKMNLSGGKPMARTPVQDVVEYDPMPTYEPLPLNEVYDVVPDESMAAPAPMVSGPLARTYIVFFDFDSNKVSKDAHAILEQAATDARKGGIVSIQVVGHADRAGSDGYNRGISQSRATNVANELVKMGVPAQLMDTMAKGESEPLVNTGDSVREIQNRRVEVTYIINR